MQPSAPPTASIISPSLRHSLIFSNPLLLLLLLLYKTSFFVIGFSETDFIRDVLLICLSLKSFHKPINVSHIEIYTRTNCNQCLFLPTHDTQAMTIGSSQTGTTVGRRVDSHASKFWIQNEYLEKEQQNSLSTTGRNKYCRWYVNLLIEDKEEETSKLSKGFDIQK